MHLSNLILKIKIFIKEYLLLHVINKRKYIPKKLVSIEGYSSKPDKYKFSVKEIIPGYLSTIKLNPAIFEICSKDFHYVNETSVKPVYLAQIPNGRLITDGSDLAVIDKDKNLLADFSLHYSDNLGLYAPEKNNVFSRKLFFKPTYFRGNVFSMYMGGGGSNYFHFLFDVLATLKILQDSEMKEKIDFYYLQEASNKFQKDALSLLGIEPHKIIEAETHSHISADNLYCVTHPGQPIHIPEWIIQFLRTNFLKYKREINGYERIFLSRKDSIHRKLLNEDEIVEQLSKFGFKSLTLSKLSFTEQISIFAKAEIVISTHGAGFANLVFGNKNCKVIELFGGKNEWPLYHALSARMNMEYHYLVAQKSENNRARNYSDFYISPKELVGLIKNVLPKSFKE